MLNVPLTIETLYPLPSVVPLLMLNESALTLLMTVSPPLVVIAPILAPSTVTFPEFTIKEFNLALLSIKTLAFSPDTCTHAHGLEVACDVVNVISPPLTLNVNIPLPSSLLKSTVNLPLLMSNVSL